MFDWLWSKPKKQPPPPARVTHTFPEHLSGIHVSYEIKDFPHAICTVLHPEYPSFQTVNLPHLCIAIAMPADYRAKAMKLGLPKQTITHYEIAEPDKKRRQLVGLPPVRQFNVPLGYLMQQGGTMIPRRTLREIHTLLDELKGKLETVRQEIETLDDKPSKDSFEL